MCRWMCWQLGRASHVSWNCHWNPTLFLMLKQVDWRAGQVRMLSWWAWGGSWMVRFTWNNFSCVIRPKKPPCWRLWLNTWHPQKHWLLSMARHLTRRCWLRVIPYTIFRSLSKIMPTWIYCRWQGAYGVTGCPAVP